jgi:hypothetical protein
MPILDVNDPNQVDHPSKLEIDIDHAGRKMVIFSGIARPEWEITDDTHLYQETFIVNLRYTVLAVDQATITVGLASIGNNDTDFQFALNTAKLCVDDTSQELMLSVDCSLMGDWSTLNRFGYQIVATVTTQITGITGSIRWKKDIFDPSALSQGEIAQLFLIAANREEIIPPPPEGGFGTVNYIPLAYGTASTLTHDKNDFIVQYNIPGAPYNQPLVVTVQVGPLFRPTAGSPMAGQIAGPSPLILTVADPGVSGVDFRVGVLVLK